MCELIQLPSLPRSPSLPPGFPFILLSAVQWLSPPENSGSVEETIPTMPHLSNSHPISLSLSPPHPPPPHTHTITANISIRSHIREHGDYLIMTLLVGLQYHLVFPNSWWVTCSFIDKMFTVPPSLFSQPLKRKDFPVAQMIKNLLAIQETRVWSLGQEDPLEKGMAIHSGILTWRIPWTEGPGGLQSKGSQRVGHDWATKHITGLSLLD